MLTIPHSKISIFKLLKLKVFNVFLGKRGNKVIAMNTHLRKDVGLCPEERANRHYSRFL